MKTDRASSKHGSILGGNFPRKRVKSQWKSTTRKIIARLEAEGWSNIGGGSHDRFVHKDRLDVMIAVPRHRELSPGTARSIARTAGWF